MITIKEKRIRLKTRLAMGYGITFAVISLLIISFMIFGVRRLMLDQIGQNRLDVLKQISERANSVKNSTITLSNLYRYDREVQKILEEGEPSPEIIQNREEYFEILKKTYARVFKDIDLAYYAVIIGDQGFDYCSEDGKQYNFQELENQLWYRRSVAENKDITFISSFCDKFGLNSENQPYVFGALSRIKNTKGEECGTLLINIKEEYLERLYQSVDKRSKIYIFDKKGNIVSSRDKSILGKNFIGVDNFRKLYGENDYHIIKKLGKNYLLTNFYDSQTGWTIVEEMPSNVIFAPLTKAIMWLLIALSSCIGVGICASYYMSRKISDPVLTLCNSMDRMRHGDFNVISHIEGYEEINQLKDSFNEMAVQIKQLMENIKKEEEGKRKSEMDFLRAQINPHFLYNTLFSIQCMIELGKNSQAMQMMAAFIDLLKKTLSVDTDLISLEEEFESTRKYLVLQQIRYSDKISFELELEEETKNCLVPALIVQPIVENAIFHGLEVKEETGMIVVESSISEGNLLITISDDGIGLDEDELEHLMERLQEREYRTSRSIGIINVQNRIKINFGDAYGLSVNSEYGIGTTVTLKLPIIQKKE